MTSHILQVLHHCKQHPRFYRIRVILDCRIIYINLNEHMNKRTMTLLHTSHRIAGLRSEEYFNDSCSLT